MYLSQSSPYEVDLSDRRNPPYETANEKLKREDGMIDLNGCEAALADERRRGFALSLKKWTCIVRERHPFIERLNLLL